MQKGYSQQHEINYTKVFVLVAKMNTIKMIIALVAQKTRNFFIWMSNQPSFMVSLMEMSMLNNKKGMRKRVANI